MSKCIYKEIADNLNKEELEEYYKTHLPKDVCKHFGFDSIYFYRIFDYLGIKRRNASENTTIQNKYYPRSQESENKRIESLKLTNSLKTDEEKQITYRKIGDAQRGIPKSLEHCKNISNGLLDYYSDPDTHPWNYNLIGAQTWIPGQSERYFDSLAKNGWFGKSKAEDEYYNYLLSIYSEDDIERNYRDKRYSRHDGYEFRCDFYIKSEDLFIEFNRWWHHGPHPFDPTNIDDINLVEKWKQLAEKDYFEGKKHSQYIEAIKTWTVRDVEKIQSAKEHNLNYQLVY